MPTELIGNRYGKSRVRLLKVVREPGHSDVYDWTVQILFTGDFDAVHTQGDNSQLLPTDTMKNTVYSRARASGATTIEQFGMELAAYFLEHNAQVSSVEVTIESSAWRRLTIDGAPHPTAFLNGSNEVETAVIAQTRSASGAAEGVRVRSGLNHLLLLKTADSAFEGFRQDPLTTLPEMSDRLLGTAVQASWQYMSPAEVHDFARLRTDIRETMLQAFAKHRSRSVQHTLHAMAEAALAATAAIDQIDLLLPNKHCLLVDLSRFGQDNPNQVFVPTDEPHGTIQASLRRCTA